MRNLKEKGIENVNVIDLLIELVEINWNFVLDFCLTKKVSKLKFKFIAESEFTNGMMQKKSILKAIKSLEDNEINDKFHYMFKRLLYHAGIIEGVVRTRGYSKEKDMWKLIF